VSLKLFGPWKFLYADNNRLKKDSTNLLFHPKQKQSREGASDRLNTSRQVLEEKPTFSFWCLQSYLIHGSSHMPILATKKEELNLVGVEHRINIL
jgi:hypothetical protein